ncbi:8192_t:CDS:2, partial [Acaulospora morrowiae]
TLYNTRISPRKATNVAEFLGPSISYSRENFNSVIEYYSVESLPVDLKKWTYQLLKENMKKFYENSNLGWSSIKKRKELREVGARYLIARQIDKSESNNLAGKPL